MIEYNAEEHERLVAGVVKSIHYDLLWNDDVMQAGRLGLLEAIDEYDDSRLIPFGMWAWRRIKSRVIDELRNIDEWKGYVAIESGEFLLREGVVGEMEEIMDMIHAHESIAPLLKCLTHEDEQIVRSYFGIVADKKSQNDIANEMHLTQGRISQRIRESLDTMFSAAMERGITLDRR